MKCCDQRIAAEGIPEGFHSASPEGPLLEVGSSGSRPAVENVLQRKSPRGVIPRDKREVVLPLQRLVKPCRVLGRGCRFSCREEGDDCTSIGPRKAGAEITRNR